MTDVFNQSWGLMKSFRAKYPGNCAVCGRSIERGEWVEISRQLGGVKCPRDCGREYII